MVTGGQHARNSCRFRVHKDSTCVFLLSPINQVIAINLPIIVIIEKHGNAIGWIIICAKKGRRFVRQRLLPAYARHWCDVTPAPTRQRPHAMAGGRAWDEPPDPQEFPGRAGPLRMRARNT